MAILPDDQIDANKTITWGRPYQRAVETIFEQMMKDGIPAERNDGAINVSAVILYALTQQARFPRRKAPPK